MKDYSTLDELTQTTKELHRKIFDKGYEQGYKVGYDDKFKSDREAVKERIDEAYNDGAYDTMKIVRMVCRLNDYEKNKLFGTWLLSEIFKTHSDLELKEKLIEWEQAQKEEICFGDEIYLEEGELYFLVTRIRESGYIEGICSNGACYHDILIEKARKTGRSFTSDLSNLLSMIGEGQDAISG